MQDPPFTNIIVRYCFKNVLSWMSRKGEWPTWREWLTRCDRGLYEQALLSVHEEALNRVDNQSWVASEPEKMCTYPSPEWIWVDNKPFSPITSSSSNYNVRFAFLPNQAPCLCVVYLWSEANVVCHLIYCNTGVSLGVQIRHARPSPSETKRFARLVIWRTF